MRCQACGIEIKNANAKFCPKCGAKIEFVPVVENTTQNATTENNMNKESSGSKKKSKLPLIIITIIVLAALIGVGVYFGCKYLIKDDKEEETETIDTKYEVEDNDTYRTANEILTNEEYTGMLEDEWTSEHDWYVFTIEEDCDVTVKFYCEEQYYGEDAYWDVNLRSEHAPDEYLTRLFVHGDTTEAELETMQLDAGTYYVTIESSNMYSSDEYSFEVVCED